jgi:diadenosine tetraphosphatase ApaH/serine/threonine PP2A family protein phosphatase
VATTPATIWQTRPQAGLQSTRLLPAEQAAILELFDQWGERDRSHRRLAHRGSRLGRFYAAPATVRRAVNADDMHFRVMPKPAKGKRRPFPSWADYDHRPAANSLVLPAITIRT